MTINPLVRTLAAQSAGRIVACHQVTYSVLRTSRTGRVELADSLDSAIFASQLRKSRSLAQPFRPQHPSPVEAGSVFGYFFRDSLEHSGAIVESGEGSVTVAEQPIDAREIRIRPLEESIAEWGAESDAIMCYSPSAADKVVDSVPPILAEEAARRGAEGWARFRREFNEKMARESAAIDALVRSALGI